MSYRIGSFNMCNFSYQSDNEIRKDISRICDIIRDNFDIVAIQEILSEGALRNQLLRNLGPAWDGRWASPRAKSTQASKGYAFLWNTSKFKLMKKKTAYGEQLVEPEIINNYHLENSQDRLVRDPYYGRFIPVNGPFFELRLFNTHIRFSADGNNESDVEDLNSPGAIAARREELNILVKSICDRKGEWRYGDNRAVYAFLLGDYNLNLNVATNPSPYLQEYIEIQDGNRRKSYRTVQNEKTTLKRADKVDETTIDKFANNYDHFTFDEERLVNGLGINLKAFRIDTLSDAWGGGDVAKHRQQISDHVPICLEININGR